MSEEEQKLEENVKLVFTITHDELTAFLKDSEVSNKCHKCTLVLDIMTDTSSAMPIVVQLPIANPNLSGAAWAFLIGCNKCGEMRLINVATVMDFVLARRSENNNDKH